MAKQVVVITGASAGIGRALARRFARDGAQIALIARGSTGLEAAAAEVDQMGGQALTIQADVADPEAIEAAAEQIEQELGPIDIWINNAANILYGRVQELSPEEVQRVSDVTYHGAVWGTMAALKRMRPRGRGTIVQVGSGAAFRGLPLMSTYCAAKHALRGFTESLRTELMHDNVKVKLTMVHLSSVNTPLYTWARNHLPRQIIPFRPIYQPEPVAETIYWAALTGPRDVTFGLSARVVKIANYKAPRLVDFILSRIGIEAQLTNEPKPDDQPDNLLEPVEGDFGTHGKYDEFARSPALLAQLVARLEARGLRGAFSLLRSLREKAERS
ncbi:MAG: SDR family oxidoreductase [Enhygromyxa sp.]